MFKNGIIFSPYYSKTYHMPNSQNRSKDQSNIVKPKRRSTKTSAPNYQEQSNKKQGNSTGNRGGAGKSPNK